MKFKVGDKVTVKTLEEILESAKDSNSNIPYENGNKNYVRFNYTDIVYNKEWMPFFCEKTFFVVSIVNFSDPIYRLGTTNKTIDNRNLRDFKEVQNFIWHEKWLRPEREFVLDFDGTPDEMET